MLAAGCATPPAAVFYDENESNNFGLPVPGIEQVAAQHTLWAGNGLGWTRNHAQHAMQHLNKDLAGFEHHATVRTKCSPRPQCHGACMWDVFGCNGTALRSRLDRSISQPQRPVPFLMPGQQRHHTGG